MIRAAAAVALLAGLALALAAERAATDPPARPALAVPLATKAPLTAVARAGDRWVAVGDYGVVLYTGDGRQWQQAGSVPVDTLLTAVTFVSAEQGWAVGHGGVVLSTGDGGRTWSTLATLEGSPTLLSVWFGDADHGLATGAYGAAFATRDGGRTWNRIEVGRDRDEELHLNHVFAAGKGLFIAAESGAAFRSTDGGQTWSRLKTGVSGSLWTGAALRSGAVLLAGMSGRLLASRDDGETWTTVDTGTDQALTGVIETPTGDIVAVGNGGVIVRVDAGLATARAEVRADRQNLAAVGALPSGLVYFGQQGAVVADAASK